MPIGAKIGVRVRVDHSLRPKSLGTRYSSRPSTKRREHRRGGIDAPRNEKKRNNFREMRCLGRRACAWRQRSRLSQKRGGGDSKDAMRRGIRAAPIGALRFLSRCCAKGGRTGWNTCEVTSFLRLRRGRNEELKCFKVREK